MLKNKLSSTSFCLTSLVSMLALQQIPAQSPDRDMVRILDLRMAAWHRTMVAVSETLPNTVVQTYLYEQPSATINNSLAKLTPSVGGLSDSQAEELAVEDFPGGVTAQFKLGQNSLTAEVVPLMIGRGTPDCEGAALYSIKVEGDQTPTVHISNPGKQSMNMWVADNIHQTELLPLERLQLENNRAYFVGGLENLSVGVLADGVWQETDNKTLAVEFEKGVGQIVIAYATSTERVRELLSAASADFLVLGQPVVQLRQQVDDYYQKLLENRIETPENALDQAFRAALYNLEYNWNEPYGWNECIHHWLAMWHNQHTAGAEWIGQTDRSRLCTATLAENLLPSGAIPHYFMSGKTRRDFGGSNQIWGWQVRHYWKYTGDVEFAREMIPALDRVLQQTFEEHDPDGNLLVAWGLQIGNQEDFIQFYNDAATPSIEMINMMRTRAELAQAVGDTELAERWLARADTARQRLLDRLWMKDLGRLANYVDEHDKLRLEAPYHSYLYPTIWGVVDELDGYTSMQHVFDRLTGADGEVYCSNLFPNHDNGTWGMQAGAAQQPWAAWGFSRAGRYQDTYRPLLAIATEVMNKNLRGAWPEIMREHNPAYFTPPAGLFVASVAEALFGLQVDQPAGVLTVAPSFPAHWPQASLSLADYQAEYRRADNHVSYHVKSAEPLQRQLVWTLPPANGIEVLVDGQPVEFSVRPGVNRVVVEALTAPATETNIEISWSPCDFKVWQVGSAAEGDTIEVVLEGASILAVEDRCGVLSNWQSEKSDHLTAQIQTGLLAPYLKYGRLGQLTFSRRTFFVKCQSQGVVFWVPINITVLPRYEAVAADPVQPNDDGLAVKLKLRNNTNQHCQGTAWLEAAQQVVPFSVDLAPRSEEQVRVDLPSNVAALFAYGDNRSQVVFPDGKSVEAMLEVVQPYQQADPLKSYLEQRLEVVALPAEDLADYQGWQNLNEGSHGGPVPWPHWMDPMQGIAEQTSLAVESLPGLEFEVTPKQWVLIGERIGKPYYRLELDGGMYRKFYLLVATFANNHDMYTELGRVTLRGQHQVLMSRSLCLPGDVDWWDPKGMGGPMNTARCARPDRLGWLPLLQADWSDWSDGPAPDLPERAMGGVMAYHYPIEPSWIPPFHPTPQFWATSRVVPTETCNFNVLEIDLGKGLQVDSLALETTGIGPGFALYGVVAERCQGMEVLSDTEFLPEERFREQITLFDLSRPNQLPGWELDGFTIGHAVSAVSLNSLVAGGERATGVARSSEFTIPSFAKSLDLAIHGGHSQADSNNQPNLAVYLNASDTDEVLGVVTPKGSPVPQLESINVSRQTGRQVYIEIIDQNTAESYAWIGLQRVTIR